MSCCSLSCSTLQNGEMTKPCLALSTPLLLHGSFLWALAQWLLGLLPCSRWPAGEILRSLLKAPLPFPAVPCNLFYWRMQESEHFCGFGFQVCVIALSCSDWQTCPTYWCWFQIAADFWIYLTDLLRLENPFFLLCLMNAPHFECLNPKPFFPLFFFLMLSVHFLPTQASLGVFCFYAFSTSVHLGSAGSHKVNWHSHIRQTWRCFSLWALRN